MTIFDGVQFSVVSAPKNCLKTPKMADFSLSIDFKIQLTISLLKDLYIVFPSVYATTLFDDLQFLVYWTRDHKTLGPPKAPKMLRGERGLNIYVHIII